MNRRSFLTAFLAMFFPVLREKKELEISMSDVFNDNSIRRAVWYYRASDVNPSFTKYRQELLRNIPELRNGLRLKANA